MAEQPWYEVMVLKGNALLKKYPINLRVTPLSHARQNNQVIVEPGVSIQDALRIRFLGDAQDNTITLKRGASIRNGLIEITGSRNTIEIGEEAIICGQFILRISSPKSDDNQFILGPNCRLQDTKFRLQGRNHTLRFEENTRYTGHTVMVGKPNRSLILGKNSTCQGVYFLVRDASIHIGEDCMFSREIEIRTSDVHRVMDVETGKLLNPPKDIVVGNGVWLAAGVTLSKGTRLAEGSIVGARAFVNKQFDTPNCLIAGVPAKQIRKGIRWER
jgi:acetyltransferase-like isoleucine patch superfamily enzyme